MKLGMGVAVAMTAMLTISATAITPFEFKDWEVGDNLLAGGDFENVTLAGTRINDENGASAWTLENGACCDRGGLYEWELDKNEAHTGKQSLRVIGVTATGTAWHAKIRHESTSMENGEEYTVAFWAKADKSRPVSLSVQMQHDPWTTYAGNNWILTNEWAEHTFTFNATADVERDMWVGLSLAESDVSFWVDDFRFWEGGINDEKDAEPRSVEPGDKLPVSWGTMKSTR
ncbi:MAG: carbohydrate binding domain-containing protein [Candidatus Poribacteria bacterium]|nr:carbohydrate binding domain-containing protein [Candidatus Poribacteria bacterium]